MSVPQYLRQISLKVGDDSHALDLSELRINFKVTLDALAAPNQAIIKIYGLSDSTAQRIPSEFQRIILQAGYAGNFGVIFDGTVTHVFHAEEEKKPEDRYLQIVAADGDKGHNFAVVKASLAAGSTADQHLQVAAQSMVSRGVTLREGTLLSTSQLHRGKVFYGMTRDVLNGLGRNQDVSWSIQAGQLTLIPNSAYLPGETVKVSSATGLLGYPTTDPKTFDVIVKTLLNPGIQIGKKLQIDNASVTEGKPSLQDDGVYRPNSIVHSGDTQDNDWSTSATCKGIDTSVPLSKTSRPQSPGVGSRGPVKTTD